MFALVSYLNCPRSITGNASHSHTLNWSSHTPSTGLPHCILSETFSHLLHFHSPMPRCYKPLPLSTKTPGHNPSPLLRLEYSLPTFQFRKSFTHHCVPNNCFFSMKLSLESLPVCTTPSVPLQAISPTYAQHLLLLSYLVISIPH